MCTIAMLLSLRRGVVQYFVFLCIAYALQLCGQTESIEEAFHVSQMLFSFADVRNPPQPRFSFADGAAMHDQICDVYGFASVVPQSVPPQAHLMSL